MVSLKIAFVVSLLIASIVDQVYSSRACFSCLHDSDNGNATIACMNKPVHTQYVRQCSTGIKAAGGLLPFADNDGDTKYKCITSNITKGNQFSFQRSCIPSYITCDLIKNSIPIDTKLDTCKICDGDLCNASSKAEVAIFTLISYLIASYVIFN